MWPPFFVSRQGDFASDVEFRLRLDLNKRFILDQPTDHNHGHRGEMAAHHLTVDRAHFLLRCHVFAFVCDVPSNAGDIFRLAASGFDDRQYVALDPRIRGR